jgi:hypothetical protein
MRREENVCVCVCVCVCVWCNRHSHISPSMSYIKSYPKSRLSKFQYSPILTYLYFHHMHLWGLVTCRHVVVSKLLNVILWHSMGGKIPFVTHRPWFILHEIPHQVLSILSHIARLNWAPSWTFSIVCNEIQCVKLLWCGDPAWQWPAYSWCL